MNRMIGLLLLLTTLLTHGSTVKAQLVKCRICDVKTGEGIAFSSIATRDAKKGCCSDIDGYFFANLNDTVRVSSLGYLPKNTVVVNTPSIDNTRIVFLEQTTIHIQELKVFGRNKEKRNYISLTSYKNKDEKGTCCSRPGYQVAVQMENNLNSEGLIEKLIFKLKLDGAKKHTCNLRLRIYDVKNTSQKLPGNDLLFENVIVKPQNGWVTVDVSKYNVPFLKGGVFVGLEWMESNTMATSNEHLNPGLCYFFGNGGAKTLTNFRENGWRSDNFIDQVGPGCMILKMEVSVKR